MSVINRYKEWNKALWHYFFPDGNANPILYLDERIISEIAERNKIEKDEDIAYEQAFLSSCLLTTKKISEFCADWRNNQGSRIPHNTNWAAFVASLEGRYLNYTDEYGRNVESIPAYFGMICSIMYLACTTKAHHHTIKEEAKIYLGKDYKGKVGELMDSLLQKLHDAEHSFDADRMICGQQANMSRIKFHTVLKSIEREDFIDFIEINNLEWGYESYSDFINYRLIPALNSANKRKFIELVTSEERIPYVKSILQSNNLQYGKKESDHHNLRQPIEIKWYYEIYFDNGKASFYIPTASALPFSVMLKNDTFEIDRNSSYSDFIAVDVPFKLVDCTKFEENNYIYHFCNIANDSNQKEIFFEKVGDGVYRQTTLCQDGHDYIMFVKNNKRNIEKLTEGWIKSEKVIFADGYVVYETSNYYSGDKPVRRRTERDKLNDTYSLNGIGTWFGIYLKENQKIYWKPDWVNFDETESEFSSINYTMGKNGKCYFNLPSLDHQHLGGQIIVSDKGSDQPDFSDHIVADLCWSGESTQYHINGWGEITEGLQTPNPPKVDLLHHYIKGHSQTTPQTNILLQVLYDIADVNGCVDSRYLVKALDFVLEMFGFIPNTFYRNNIIYALKRLGYMISYKTGRNNYVNQLTPAFLELSNYEISTTTGNAYLIKGVYSNDCIETLKNSAMAVIYLRPYDKSLEKFHPEYKILPDSILIRTNDTLDWIVKNRPIAYDLINMMEGMGNFYNHYKIHDRGDIDPNIQDCSVPFIKKDNYGVDVLYTKRGYNFIKHKTFQNGMGCMELIPKHLMRAYCQNEKCQPVCIFEKQRNIGREVSPDQNVIFSTITFASGMARPQVLDMALCDLNLGLPKSEYLFIVDQNAVGIPSIYSYIEGLSYSTDATRDGHRYIQQALEKLSNRTIDCFSQSSAVLVCKNRDQLIHQNKLLSMKVIKQNSDNSYSLILNHGDHTIAFSYRNNIFAYSTQTHTYHEIIGDGTINEKLSNIINGIPQKYGLEFGGMIPDYNAPDAEIVRIIKKES